MTSTDQPNLPSLTLEAILTSAAVGIVTMKEDGCIIDANPAAHRLFGYATGGLTGQRVEILMPEPHRERHAEYVYRYMRSGQAKIIGIGREVPGLRKDGSTFPLHLSVGEVSVSNGPRLFTGIMIDLSAQHEAEDLLRRQRAEFQSIFESQPDAIVISDPSRRVVRTNQAFERVFGFPGTEIVGSHAERIYADAGEWERASVLDSEIGTEGAHQPTVLQFRRADGETFPGALVRTVIRDAATELGYLSVIRDISGEVRREAQLMQAQRMEAVGALTGGIAHDFNNILTVILGNLELLEPRLAAAFDRTLAQEAMEAAEMGARLTDRLLTFGRRQHLDKRKINLNEFVLSMIDILRRTIGENIDLSTSLAGDLWTTEADPGQIENAVLNLAINARDAMSGGGRINIETRNIQLDEEAVAVTPELPPGSYVVLAVSDTGHGMNEAVRARAFEPFFSTKGPGKGSGLGLATIYGFAKQSGGHATIYSEEGQGTVVNIYLPRVIEEVAAGRASDAIEAPNADGRGERILVVEDDPRVRRLTATRIKALGYQVLEAETGAGALAMIEGGTEVDIVFSDIVMPGGLSGLDLRRHLASHHPGVKVILTSGYAQDFINQGPGALEPVELLRKPYRQADLAEALRTALD